jgi:transglutaminase-like putative cysteine protease
MRISGIAHNLLLISILLSPAFIRAQFKQPTDEELKMTSDPKAPGEAAVYLNEEETTNDDLHYRSVYMRIKVLQEKGKELATVDLPYVKSDTRIIATPGIYGTQATSIDELKGRTIHPDGTVIPMTASPADLFNSKKEGINGELQLNRKVFTLPSVEVGSILEYSYKIRFDDFVTHAPFWEIQRQYYVHSAHYEYVPSKEFLHGLGNYFFNENGKPINTLVMWQVLPPGVTVKRNARGYFSLDVNDIPPMPNEDWMPPVQNFRIKVLFYLTAEGSINDFWPSKIKHWTSEVDRLAEATPGIHDAVTGNTAPGDSDLDKAKKLYNAVQALDNTDYSRQKSAAELRQYHVSESKSAESTWMQKSGSSEDIAILYLSMLRAAGLTAKAMRVVNRQWGIFDRGYLNFDQLGDTIIVLNLDGEQIRLDPGEKMCPFELLNWRHSNASGFIQGSNGAATDNTPPQNYTDNNTTRRGDLTLDSQGGVQGTLRFAMIGQEALKWRQIALRNDESEVKREFDSWLETIVPAGVEAHIDHFANLDNPDANLVEIINVKGTLGTATGKRVLLPGVFFDTRNRRPFVDEENRQEPVDMHYSEVVNDNVVYHFPDSLMVEGAPQDAQIPWAGKANFSIGTIPAHNQITVNRKFARAFTFVMKDQYQDLRGFYQKIAAADQQQLVLTASDAAKGN